jgi:hypothetical protein
MLKNFFKNFDLFGYKINLNFNKKGELVKTNIGGAVSLLMIMTILAYGCLKLNVMKSKT